METPDYLSMMLSTNRYGLDGPTEQYHKHVAHSQSTKDSTQLENINRFFDKCKEQKVHEFTLEERELKKTLMKLEREKIENKKKGSSVERANIEEEKKRKVVAVKLQPGKIDFERMSPPSSHDVAVRMLFDKKGQPKKKKTKKKADHLSGPETLEASFSHKETSTTLPALSDEETTRRRYRVSGSEDHTAEHDIRFKSGAKGTKGKKRNKKAVYAVNAPSPPKPDIVVLAPEQQPIEIPSSPHTDDLASSIESFKRSGPPKVPHRAWAGISDSIDEEVDQVPGQGSKLPHLLMKSNLVENSMPQQREDHFEQPYDMMSARKRRASLDYKDLDFLQSSSSFSPTSNVMHRRASVGGAHDISKPRGMQEDHHGLDKKGSKTKSTKKLDIYMLDHYYTLLSDTQKILKEEDPNFAIPRDASRHLPLCTLKRSQKRKARALEVLLKQLPGYKHTEIEPKDILNCRYLRLSRNNVEELENMCREEGREPGLHAHMTQQEVEDYFDRLDQLDHSDADSDTDSEVELLCGGSPTGHQLYH